MKRKVQLWKQLAPGFQINQDTDICYICFDLKVEPVKCSTCKTTYCKYCAEKWGAKGNNKCPNRCSEDWKYQPCNPLELKLACVYQCGQLFVPDDYIKHGQECKKNPQPKIEQDMKLQYLCSLGHPLKYLSDPNTVPLNIQCASCEVQKSICRSACVECQKNGETYFRYCCQCRIPKGLTKSCCPAGHNNFYIRPVSKCFYTICDMCSIKIQKNGNCCAQDKVCDFAICKLCYEKLEDGPGQILNLADYVEPVEPMEPVEPVELNIHDLLVNMESWSDDISSEQSPSNFHEDSYHSDE